MSKQRADGTEWESRCRDYLNSQGLHLAREDFSSPLGDLKGAPLVIECKSGRSWSPGDWIAQAKKSLAKTGWRVFVILKKKPNCHVSEGYMITTIAHGATLLRAYEFVANTYPHVLERED